MDAPRRSGRAMLAVIVLACVLPSAVSAQEITGTITAWFATSQGPCCRA